MELEPGLRLIRAPNPSPMTFTGTNTYLLGATEIAVIDPGPDDPAHQAAILSAIGDAPVRAILVTHSHLDHSPLAAKLAQVTGAPVMAAGPSDWGRRPAMEILSKNSQMGGGEGIDPDFRPDRPIGEGDVIEAADWRVEVLATPGHMANHLSFAWNGALFSGDLVMGWATSLVSPPDGDMTSFMQSVARLETRRDRVFYPGHGDPVTDPAARCRELLEHRRGRERQITDALGRHGGSSAAELAALIYTDVDPALLPAAARNVLAHLLDLAEKNIAAPDGILFEGTRFKLR